MDAKFQERTASTLVILTGLWVALSPLMFSMSQNAVWNAVIASGALVVMGIAQLFFRSPVPSVVGIFLSAWLIIAALVFEQSVAAAWSLIIAGIVGAVVAAWDTIAAQDIDSGQTMHRAT